MRKTLFPLVVAAILSSGSSADDTKTIIVTAITHESHVSERTSDYTTPGRSNTNCIDNPMGMNCETQSTPATTTTTTRQITEVTEKVIDSDNMVYTIVCTHLSSLVGRDCAPLEDGDQFDAEIKGTTMWVQARKGGNQGKAVKIKYKILDIRKKPPQAAAIDDACRGDERDTSEVWRLGRRLGEKDNEIADAIKQLGVCPVLIYLQGEAGGQHPQQMQAQAVSTTVTAQSSPQSRSFALAGRFQQHVGDFLDFAESHRNSRKEYETSMILANIAERTYMNLDSTRALLEVYENISSSPDRARIQPLIKLQVLRYSQNIEASASAVNSNLAIAKVPTIAATGDRMKQDLREAKAFLDSLQTSLE